MDAISSSRMIRDVRLVPAVNAACDLQSMRIGHGDHMHVHRPTLVSPGTVSVIARDNRNHMGTHAPARPTSSTGLARPGFKDRLLSVQRDDYS